jgi:hypothetical protein
LFKGEEEEKIYTLTGRHVSFPTAAAKQKWPRASQWPPTGGNVRRRRFWAAAVFSFFDLVLFHFVGFHPLLVTGPFSWSDTAPSDGRLDIKSPLGGTCGLLQNAKLLPIIFDEYLIT